MISRSKKNASSSRIGRTQNTDKYQDLPEKQLSENRYKQTKLPLKFLGRSKRKAELNFILEDDFRGHFVYLENTDEKYKFLFQFKWPELGQMVNLCCDQKLLPDLKIEYIDRPKLSAQEEQDQQIWFAILKSHLQKTIRRGKTDLALATANLMFDICPIKLFRRLPIIMIEDVCLDSNCAALVWLMVFFSDRLSRCFKNDQRVRLKSRIRNFVLSEVFHLSQYPTKDEIKYLPDCQLKLKNWTQLIKDTSSTRDQIYSLQLRKIYGGMKGDLEMIDQYSLKWLDQNNELVNPVIMEFNIEEKITKLNRHNFILAAVDFHCCPWILDRLNKKNKCTNNEVIKNTIWYASSCLNWRTAYQPCDAYVKTLQIFKNDWYNYAQEIIDKYLEFEPLNKN